MPSKNRVIRNKKIGILGGGQLGRMLVQEATKWDLDISFIDKGNDFPLPQIFPHYQQGDFNNYEDVLAFGKNKDILSIEIENVNTKALYDLEKLGKQVYPQARVIELIKDKGLQKSFYLKEKIPSSNFIKVESKQAILSLIDEGKLQFPFIQKSRTAGYDGKGVAFISDNKAFEKIMDVPSIIEDFVSIQKELAVMIGRNAKGQTTLFPITEMVFNQEGNLLDYLLSPAEVNVQVKNRCNELAEEIITKMDMVGLLAVEFFLTKDNDILVNEVAPRPHNSGHFSMDSCNYSQFNVHLRTLLNLELPVIVQSQPSAMLNLLGELEVTGKPNYIGLEKIMDLDGVYPHIYGKQTTKPLRKMGHVNIMAATKEALLEKLELVKSIIKVSVCL